MERTKMRELLQVDENQMDFNIFYLGEKGLIDVVLSLDTPWYFAKITAFGIDVIQNKPKFKTEFPFIQTNIQHIQGNVYAPVTQAVDGPQVSFNDKVTNAFSQANIVVEERADLSEEQKEEIKSYLRQLQDELGKEESDVGKIQKLWKWLKENANWVVPTLVTVVLEGSRIALNK
jgi:hypothetical protein